MGASVAQPVQTMIKAVQSYLASIPAVFTDGLVYVLLAWCGAWGAVFASDEAAKYLAPQLLFWIKSMCATSGAALLSIKMFRSTSFADHQAEKKRGDTWPPVKPPTDK